MATVKVILRKNHINKSGKAPLRVRLLHQDQIKEITLPGVRVEPHLWDPITQTVKGDKMLNLRIQNKVSDYNTAINKSIVINDAVDLESIHRIVAGENLQNSKLTVYEYIKLRILEDQRLSLGTRKYYKSLYNILITEYPKLKLNQVNGTFLSRFRDRLQKKGLSLWTCHSRLKCLKSAVNKAYEDRLINTPDWRGFKNRKGTSTRQFLTTNELTQLKSLLSEIKLDSLDGNVLRAFLFSCYCSAMRFGDLLMLTYGNVSYNNEGNLQLSYTMRKTKKHIHLPLNKVASELIDEDKIGSDEMIFKLAPYSIIMQDRDVISRKISSRNAYCNKRLKVIMDKAGIKKSISFHCARITFCSIAISLGMSRFMITEIAGVTLKVLEEHYAKYFEDKKAEAVALFDKI